MKGSTKPLGQETSQFLVRTSSAVHLVSSPDEHSLLNSIVKMQIFEIGGFVERAKPDFAGRKTAIYGLEGRQPLIVHSDADFAGSAGVEQFDVIPAARSGKCGGTGFCADSHALAAVYMENAVVVRLRTGRIDG